MEEQVYVPWTVHTKKPREVKQIPGQMDIFSYVNGESTPSYVREEVPSYSSVNNTHEEKSSILHGDKNEHIATNISNSSEITNGDVTTEVKEPSVSVQSETLNQEPAVSTNNNTEQYEQMSLIPKLDRESVIKFINEQGFLTYIVRNVKINSYLKSLLSLAGILTQNLIHVGANDEVKTEVTDLMKKYIDKLHSEGKYDELAKQVMEYKLSIQIFDVFGEAINNYYINDFFATAESDIDRQLRAVDAKLGGYGFPYVYGRRFIDFDNPNAFKVDCILYAADDECMRELNKYAEEKFHALDDKYRKYLVSKSEKCRKQYSDIIRDGDEVSKHNFTLPETISARLEAGGEVYTDHLFADEEGKAKIKLNGWEADVLKEERKRDDFVCWLRNPARQSWALCLPYEIEGQTKATYPDFVIIRKDDELGYVMDILEPHNPDFKDNLGKAKAFAMYASLEARIGRIQLIRTGKDAAGKNRFKRLDMSKGAVRNKVMAANNTDELDHIFDTDGEFQD